MDMYQFYRGILTSKIRYSPKSESFYVIMTEGDLTGIGGIHSILPLNVDEVDPKVLQEVKRDYLRNLSKQV